MTRAGEAFLSQHIGSLDNAPTCTALDETVDHLCEFSRSRRRRSFTTSSRFYSTRFAARFASARAVPMVGAQHHHAHIAAVLAEHRVRGPVLGVALDGVGLGVDGTAWGGELLRVSGAHFDRLGHLARIALPGGDRAAHEPWRMAAAALHLMGRGSEIPARFQRPAAPPCNRCCCRTCIAQ